MKILIDMNLSPDWTAVFRAQGWEAVHWSTTGNPRAADRVVMDWARANGYAVFTHDLDFGSLLVHATFARFSRCFSHCFLGGLVPHRPQKRAPEGTTCRLTNPTI
jgi:hypothetical protein